MHPLPYRFFVLMSISHLPSSVIQLPRYLYYDTCSNAVLLTAILQGTFPVLLITMVFVFFTFISIPYTLQISAFVLDDFLKRVFFIAHEDCIVSLSNTVEVLASNYNACSLFIKFFHHEFSV